MDPDVLSATIVAGVLGNALFHPLETIRVIHQTSPVHSTSQYVLKPVSRYWYGLLPSAVFSAPAFAVDVSVYRGVKQTLGGNSVQNYAIAGAAAQLSASLLMTPVEIISGRLQLRGHGEERSMLREISQIWKTEGVRGFFRGYWMELGIYLPYTIAWWTCYDSFKGSCGVPLASAMATVVGETGSNLLSVVKTRTMLASSPNLQGLRPSDLQGARQVLVNLVREAGLGHALVRGLHIRLITALPASMFSMALLEYLAPDPTSNELESV